MTGTKTRERATRPINTKTICTCVSCRDFYKRLLTKRHQIASDLFWFPCWMIKLLRKSEMPLRLHLPEELPCHVNGNLLQLGSGKKQSAY